MVGRYRLCFYPLKCVNLINTVVLIHLISKISYFITLYVQNLRNSSMEANNKNINMAKTQKHIYKDV